MFCWKHAFNKCYFICSLRPINALLQQRVDNYVTVYFYFDRYLMFCIYEPLVQFIYVLMSKRQRNLLVNCMKKSSLLKIMCSFYVSHVQLR